MRPLHQCLLDVELIRLQAIARLWGVELTTQRKQDVAAQLAETMSQPAAVAEARGLLTDEQRQALDALLAAGGESPLRTFSRRWGEIRAMGPGRMEREQPWRAPISPAEGLWYAGFIFSAFEQGPAGAFEAVFVPPELQAHLPRPSQTLPVIALDPSPAPAAVPAAGDALLDDTCTLLAYLQNEPVRLAAASGWPARHAARLLRQLRSPDPARLEFLLHLIRRLDWLRAGKDGCQRPAPGPVAAWLQAPSAQQREALAAAWRDDPTWNDLFHVPSLRAEETGAWRNDPLLARQAVLDCLKALDPGAWYSLDGLIAAVKQVNPDFQRPGGDYTTWYIRDAATGAYLSGFESWEAVEGALIRYIIAGPLAWLGLADVNADAPPTAFRLSPAGAAFLGLGTPPPPPAPAPLRLRPDFSLLVPPERRYERFQLSRVADWVASPRLGEDGHFAYRLTPHSLARAKQQGIAVSRVLEFLEQATGAPPPRALATALARWEARGGEARLERAVLLRLPDESLMNQIASTPAARPFILERLAPTIARVRERDLSRLLAALGELGLLADVLVPEGDLGSGDS